MIEDFDLVPRDHKNSEIPSGGSDKEREKKEVSKALSCLEEAEKSFEFWDYLMAIKNKTKKNRRLSCQQRNENVHPMQS